MCCFGMNGGSPPLHSHAAVSVPPRVITIIPTTYSSNPGTATMPLVVDQYTHRGIAPAPHHASHHGGLGSHGSSLRHGSSRVHHGGGLGGGLQTTEFVYDRRKAADMRDLKETLAVSKKLAQMSAGFGFSVGDFIAAIDLVATVIDALRESGNCSSEFREIVRQLDTLEDTLRRVKRLELNDSQQGEGIALQKAASRCQITIHEFWKKIQKYQPHLRSGGSSSRLKDGWMKIVWATFADYNNTNVLGNRTCKPGLTTSNSCGSNPGRVFRLHATTAFGRFWKYPKVVHNLYDVLAPLTLHSGLVIGKRILDTALEIKSTVIETNIRVFQMVLEIHQVITHIPSQVNRQHPVYLIDALGRHTPFHLEFIRLKEAFVSVLKINFSHVGRAASIIEHGDFAIQDSATKRDIQLQDDWELCFSPGQKVEMSMIFRQVQVSNNCARCDSICHSYNDGEVECPKCGISFRIITEVEDHDPTPNILKDRTIKPADADIDDDLRLFRRVRIKCRLPIELERKIQPLNNWPRNLTINDYYKAQAQLEEKSRVLAQIEEDFLLFVY
ncbi:hypothetical protein SBOR_6386 [Sclerotinia borealis F-4128]|uniref:Ubiquitin-like domain-containing protein n=1 Tax=Sclerotinia borealis (strain F-4128) TaxID=1432307 RepID=W9CFB0_SCLBF|nr:hypothetical protein SBOR_6386 [Sclerotinia borealis F-4128]